MRAKKSVLSLAVTLAMTTGLALSTQAHAAPSVPKTPRRTENGRLPDVRLVLVEDGREDEDTEARESHRLLHTAVERRAQLRTHQAVAFSHVDVVSIRRRGGAEGHTAPG